MRKNTFCLTFIILTFSTGLQTVNAQGCSDAGFCSLKFSSSSGHVFKNTIAIGNTAGVADGNTFVNSTYISYSRQLKNAWFWDTKINAAYASGTLANNFNAGDVVTTFSATVFTAKSKKQNLNLSAGLKIPLTASNDKAGGKPMPMAYQTSLGTFDVLFGASYAVNNWEFTNAWQLPITQVNKNSFFETYSVSNDFPSTNKFMRRADVLFRAAYLVNNVTPKISLKPNLLAIYHLGKDSYEDIFSVKRTLTGSEGLTVNANIIGTYLLSRHSSIEISVASPFVVRKLRPDGLTRKFTAGVEYRISF